MDKSSYMKALRSALEGLPAPLIEETIEAYERKFAEAALNGKSEEELLASLPQPELIAAQKKTSIRYDALKRNFTIGNIAGLLVAMIGLMVFNLFMLIPAMTYFILLCSSYVVALCLYLAGIGITAASLSGVDQFSFQLPAGHHHVVHGAHHRNSRDGHYHDVRVDISETGVLIDGEQFDDHGKKTESSGVTVTLPNTASASATTAVASATATASQPAVTVQAEVKVRDRDSFQIEVSNHFSAGKLLSGLGAILAGIGLFMLSMFLTKYSFIGFKHYVRWNLSQLQLVRPA